MTNDWIDITLPLRNGMPVWPGDTPFTRSSALAIARGDECNLSAISTTAHIGTHMDAPRHYLEGAAGIDALPIAATIGRARVIEIHDPDAIRIAELEPHHLQPGERVLFKTRNSLLHALDHFTEDFVAIPPDTARYLADRAVQTIGVDYLSVGAADSTGSETHRILLTAGIWVIEGLSLSAVAPSDYELVCLPLKIVDGDGAPARAVLRSYADRS